MRDDFCAFILTHGRPDRVTTYNTIRKQGYTGKIYVVIDDEDKTEDQYRERYGDEVLQFSKAEIAKTFDEGDNFNDRRAIIYARNACWKLAEQVGCKYFIQLDDDYSRFDWMLDKFAFACEVKVNQLDWLFTNLVSFLCKTPFHSVAISQSGDHIGGRQSSAVKSAQAKRKAMNSFVCSTEKPFQFVGRINEDVNTYTSKQRKGVAFMSFMQARLTQKQTQSNSGGMTDLYLDSGTYVKSFYSVMYCPSAVVVGSLRGGGTRNGVDNNKPRLHHSINWNAVAPLILRDDIKKGPRKATPISAASEV